MLISRQCTATICDFLMRALYESSNMMRAYSYKNIL